jgi:hypothetical protein
MTTMSSREGNSASREADPLDMVEAGKRVDGVVISCSFESSISLSKSRSKCVGGITGDEGLDEPGLC